MIGFNGVTLRRGSRDILRDTSFVLHPGWHVGIVGRNGSGKSSVFAAILGQLTADQGDVSAPAAGRIAWVTQETPALEQPALDFVLDGDGELRAVEARLAIAERDGHAEQLSALHEQMHVIDGYAARARAAQLLAGLGFPESVQSNAVASFSGGWRMRLNLARALGSRAPTLLLDEPTNHLDLDAVIWLQDWVAAYRGTLLVISHDREFLDATTQHTLHLHAERAQLYTGNFSLFEKTRAERLALQAASYAKQQREIAHLQDFVRRFRAKATKASQAQSRVKALQRMELVAAVYAEQEPSITLPAPQRLPAPMLRLDQAEAGYPGRSLLRGVRMNVAPGARIGLLGHNGSGKSTLLRTLSGDLPALSGTLHRDPYLRVGYFAQHTADALDPAASPLLHLRRLDPAATELALRSFLGGFAFSGERALEPAAKFSGGEKARLALALVAYREPNLLLLDEPTNHLDMDMRHALEMALVDFAGAVVLVSHDRHLLTSSCDEFWLVADGRCEPFPGDLPDYVKWLRARGEAPAPAPAAATRSSAKQERQAAAAERERQRPLRESIRRLDAEMETLHARLADVERRLADTAIYDAARAAELAEALRQQGEWRKRLSVAEDEWLQASEALESLRA